MNKVLNKVPEITKKLNENSQRLFQKENTFVIIFQKYCKEWQLVLMFLPVILCLAIFHYVPIYGVIIAFKDYKIIQGILGSPWVGLKHSTGFVNQIITYFGGKPIYFLADIDYFVPTLIVTGIWKGIGWGTIIYLAAISNINPELYEAAIVDGANRFKRVIHITLPSIAPVISILFILNSGNLINAGFDQIFNLYNEAVYRVADIIDTYVYRRGIQQAQYSFSTAVGLFKNIISFSLVLITNIIVRKINNEGGIW